MVLEMRRWSQSNQFSLSLPLKEDGFSFITFKSAHKLQEKLQNFWFSGVARVGLSVGWPAQELSSRRRLEGVAFCVRRKCDITSCRLDEHRLQSCLGDTFCESNLYLIIIIILHVCVCVLCVCFADVEEFSTAHNALSPSEPHLCQLQARVAPSTPLLLPPSPSPPDKERTAHHILEILPPVPTHYTHSQSLSL